jgi:hypothetical protein
LKIEDKAQDASIEWWLKVTKDCFVASLLAMTVYFIICIVTPKTNLTYQHSHCEPDEGGRGNPKQPSTFPTYRHYAQVPWKQRLTGWYMSCMV